MAEKLLSWLAAFIAILALVYPALVNGFPLVYSDSGTYIIAAPDHYIPVDRPIGYSIFIQLSSLSISLWLTVFVQAIITVYLIYLVYRDILQLENALFWSSATLIILSLTTGISNYASQLMPDILVSIMLLISSIILLGKKRSIFSNVLLAVIFLFTIISHFSNLLIATIALVLIIGINLWKKWFEPNRVRLYSALIIAGWLIVPSINIFYGGGFTLARTQNIFFIGRLTQEGIVGEYLHEYCSKTNYSLCEYINDLPKESFMFEWDEKSPLYAGDCIKNGWGSCWIEKDKEYGILIKDIITTPKYFVKVVKMAIKSTLYQLVDFEIGPLNSMKVDSPPYTGIKRFYPRDLKTYLSAKQYSEDLTFSFESNIQLIFVYLSILGIIGILLVRKIRVLIPAGFWLFTGIIVTGVVLNAAICSSLSTVVNRFQSRVIWLLPLLFLLALPFWLKEILIQLNKYQRRK